MSISSEGERGVGRDGECITSACKSQVCRSRTEISWVSRFRPPGLGSTKLEAQVRAQIFSDTRVVGIYRFDNVFTTHFLIQKNSKISIFNEIGKFSVIDEILDENSTFFKSTIFFFFV